MQDKNKNTTITINKQLHKKLSIVKITDDFEDWDSLLEKLLKVYEASK